MSYRLFWAILALVLAVPSILLGQVVVRPPMAPCLCPDTAKNVAPKPRAVSKPVAQKRPAVAPVVVARKPDTTFMKTIGGVDSMVVSMPDTFNLHVFGKVEVVLSDADRAAMLQSQRQAFEGRGQHRRGWWARNWGWPVGVAVGGTALVVIGHQLGWWGGGDITQCAFVGSPGAVCPRK